MAYAKKLVTMFVLILMAGCSNITSTPVDSADADLVLSDTIRLGVRASGIELYRLSPRQRLFSNWDFRWRRVPAEFRGKAAVRVAMNDTTSITLRSSVHGRLYAVLWKWDYGFLEQLPPEHRTTVNGWQLVRDDGGRALGATAPFDTLPLYALNLTPGTHRLSLGEYVGQYVIVGFVPSTNALGSAGVPAPASIETSLTRHHILEPGAPFTITSSATVDGFSLFRNDELIQSGAGPRGTAPREPGRYVLQVNLSGGTRILPLTVGYGRVRTPGWEPGFFPITFYNGWSYAGEFTPNPDLLLDLQTIAMFELGANTLFMNEANEITDTLGFKVILNYKGKAMPLTRTSTDAKETEERFRTAFRALVPLPASTLGLYVEDEPPASVAVHLFAMERAMRDAAPQVALLYTLQGYHAPDFWKAAGSTVRMTRAYPIRKNTRGDQKPSIQEELTDFLTLCQKQDPSRPLWIVIQAFGDRGRPNIWDPPTPAQLRLMVNLSLARGVKALTYFCFDSSSRGRENISALARWPFVPQDERYEEVGRINAIIRSKQAFLSSLTWVEELTPENGDVDVQILSNAQGERFAWITNWDTQHATIAAVRLPGRDGMRGLSLEPAASEIIDLQTGESIEF